MLLLIVKLLKIKLKVRKQMLNLRPIAIHEHSTVSDGKETPESLQAFAKDNLDLFTITDHDRFNYCNGLLSAEVSARVSYLNREHTFHLLVYIPILKPLTKGTDDQKLLRQIHIFTQQEKILKITNKLNDLYFDDSKRIARYWLNGITHKSKGEITFTDNEVAKIASQYQFRHFDNIRKENEYNEEITTYMLMTKFKLKEKVAKKLIEAPSSTIATHLQAPELIKLVKEAKGFVIVAHPSITTQKILSKIGGDQKSIKENIKILQALLNGGPLNGVDGIEVGYPFVRYLNPLSQNIKNEYKYDNEIYNALLHLATKSGLCVSAGDDNHGTNTHGDGLEGIGYLHNQPIIYFDFLKLIKPKMAEKRYNYLVDNNYIKPEDKIFIAPDIVYQKEYLENSTLEQTI